MSGIEQAGNDPVDKSLWASCVAAAKRKFQVYPSAYANGWAVQEYKRRGGKWREKSSDQDLVPVGWLGWDVEAASKDEGLGKWFAEKWVDISRTNSDGSHPACGRPTAGMSSGDYRKAYPKCVPASRAAGMSAAAKKSAVDRKRDADNAGGAGSGQKPKMVSTKADVEAAKGPSATAKDKNPKGGLSAAGRKKFGVKKGVTDYSSAGDAVKRRWVRWALRFTKTPRPLTKPNGEPTRYALMFHAWGEPVPTSADAVRAVHAKAIARARTLKMGQYAETAHDEDIYFIHQWEPVAGQPLEVAHCEICGISRYSEEHRMYELEAAAERLATAGPLAALVDLPTHHFHLGGNGRCMTCNQIQAHPLHNVDPIQSGDLVANVAAEHTGAMVALYPDSASLDRIEVLGDLPVEKREDMHITLVYLKDGPTGSQLDVLRALVAAQCAQQEPLTGSWGGTGRFNPTEGSDGKPVLVALPDLPDLPEFRQDLVELLEDAGFEPAEDHGYTPHLTVAYDDNGRVRAMGELNCPIVAVVAAGGRVDFQLTGTEDDGDTDATMAEAAAVMVRCVDCGDSYAVDSMDEVAVHKAKHAEGDVEKAALSATDEVALAAESKRIAERKKLPAASARHNFRPARFTHPNGHPRCLVCGDEESTGGVCNAREAARTRSRVPVEPEGIRHGVAAVPTKAFLTEAYGRTVLTAPAAVWEKALTPNEHFLWMQGRFVGAEKANRNGAFWSTADLEMGEPTVKGGPLNWLHEDRHVIGSIVEAKLVMPGAEAAADGQLAEPHIVAASAAWKWLYPDECYVMEQASDQGKLWYSMECVAKQVSCVGDGGCGQTYGYGDVMKAAENVCQHIIQRSASRRMVDPTFLGGAVIVPPVRPGWGDADAQVMRQAASMAEKAFDQAGQPDVTASDWELLMRQVLSFIAR